MYAVHYVVSKRLQENTTNAVRGKWGLCTNLPRRRVWCTAHGRFKIVPWSSFREASNLPQSRQAPDVKKRASQHCDKIGNRWESFGLKIEVVKAKDTKTEGEPLVASGLHLSQKKNTIREKQSTESMVFTGWFEALKIIRSNDMMKKAAESRAQCEIRNVFGDLFGWAWWLWMLDVAGKKWRFSKLWTMRTKPTSGTLCGWLKLCIKEVKAKNPLTFWLEVELSDSPRKKGYLCQFSTATLLMDSSQCPTRGSGMEVLAFVWPRTLFTTALALAAIVTRHWSMLHMVTLLFCRCLALSTMPRQTYFHGLWVHGSLLS